MLDGGTNYDKGNNYGSRTWSGGTIGGAVFGLGRTTCCEDNLRRDRLQQIIQFEGC